MSSSPSPPHPRLNPSPAFERRFIDSAVHVTIGSTVFTATAALLGSAIGTLQADPHRPATTLAYRSAFNVFAFVFPFYSIREYAIKPLLPAPLADNRSPHTTDLLSSFLSGGLTGAGVVGFSNMEIPWKLKITKMPRSMAIFSALCAGMQFVGNELNVMRIKRLAKNLEKEQPIATMPSTALAESVPGPPSAAQIAASPPKPGMITRAFNLFGMSPPVTKVSDDDYVKYLEDKQRELQQDLETLESEGSNG